MSHSTKHSAKQRTEIRIAVPEKSRQQFKDWLKHFRKSEPLWIDPPRMVRGSLRVPILVFPYLMGYAHTDWLSAWDIARIQKTGKKQLRYLFTSSEAPIEVSRQALHAWRNLLQIPTGAFFEGGKLSTPA